MNVGDKVKVIDGSYYDDYNCTFTGLSGKVISILNGSEVLFDVTLDRSHLGRDNITICFAETELEVIQ